MTSLEQYNILRYTINLISNSVYGKYLIIKGGSALVSKMLELNHFEYLRKTSDIDIHCDKKEVWEHFCSDIESILNNNQDGYIYRLISRRADTKGFDTSDSLKFEIKYNNSSFIFKMDMNIKSNAIIFVEYSALLNMGTYDKYTMLSDKIVVVSSKKIYRRIKDLYDICVLASLYDFELSYVYTILNKKHPNVSLQCMLNPANYESIKHAYDKFQGIDNKPVFEYVYTLASIFLEPIYKGVNTNLVWRKDFSSWNQ